MYKLKDLLRRRFCADQPEKKSTPTTYLKYLGIVKTYRCETDASDTDSIERKAERVVQNFDAAVKKQTGIDSKDCIGCKVVSTCTLIGIFSLLASNMIKHVQHPPPERFTKKITVILFAGCKTFLTFILYLIYVVSQFTNCLMKYSLPQTFILL